MSLNDLFHKGKKEAAKDIKKVKEVIKPSKSRNLVEAELKAEMDSLEAEYKYMIKRQFQIRNQEGLSKGARDRADAKIELCLGALNLLKLAREDLQDASTAAMLAGDMRTLGKSLKVMNRLYSATPNVRTGYLNKQIKKMNNYSQQTAEDLNIKAVLDETSMEGMGAGWQKRVEQVISGEMSVDEFIKRSGEIDSPYVAMRGFDERDSDYLRDLSDYDAASPKVEGAVDQIYNNADELDALHAYKKSMDDIY